MTWYYFFWSTFEFKLKTLLSSWPFLLDNFLWIRIFCRKFHCVSKSYCLDMQKYQFWRNSHSQNTFFIHIEATENTFLLQKKVIFHAEQETVKKGVLNLPVILTIVTVLLKTSRYRKYQLFLNRCCVLLTATLLIVL